MPLLDQVIKMQQEGLQDKDIAKKLREQGFTPKEVIDAISQSKIKSAVSGATSDQLQSQIAMTSQPIATTVAPAPQEQYQQSSYPAYPEQYPQAYPSYPEQYPQQSYPQYQSTDTAREAAEEIAEEKVSELREQISQVSSLKKEFESKFQDLDRRLKQIENSLDKLQMAILGKITDYSKDLKNLTDEMRATQESFKKVINPVVDKVREKASKKKVKEE